MPNLWLLPRPLILASKSQARRSLLAAAGISFEAIDAEVDERVVEAPLRSNGSGPGLAATIATKLAREKAMAVSADQPARMVLGCDQTLSLGSEILTKPADRGAAKRQLLAMAGQVHTLHAALCLVSDRVVLAEASAEAHLTCRAFTASFIDCYLDYAGDSVLQSVGAYAVEGLGIHLFDKIEGDQSTILGLPMIPLLKLLRDHGAVEI